VDADDEDDGTAVATRRNDDDGDDNEQGRRRLVGHPTLGIRLQGCPARDSLIRMQRGRVSDARALPRRARAN